MSVGSYPEWRTCLTHLLDPDVSEVECQGPGLFFIKKKGKRIHLSDINLESNERYADGIENGLVPFVRQVIEYDPHGYLFEGPLYFRAKGQTIRGRCHIVLPPATQSPIVTIAKKSTSLATLDSIAERGSMALEMANFMKLAIDGRLSLVLSGASGAGKTTMLEACSKLFPMHERIGVAEDTPELDLIQPNTIYQHSVPWKPGMDRNNVATLAWVVEQFQRQRLDRSIVGETRSGEFAAFLTAANSGIDGSMTTLHANTPTECLTKMTNFALKGSDGNTTIRTVNTDISTAIDIIVQLIILPDGRHKTAAITEVTNTIGNGEDAKITTNELYTYDVPSDTFVKAGQMTDALRRKFEERGVEVSSLLSTPVGTRLPPHGSRPGGSGAPRGGNPFNGGRTL